MSRPLKALEEEALQLTPDDRAKLADHLIASLDPEPLDTADAIEQAWLEESARRDEAYRRGEMKGQPAGEAIADLLAERD